MKNKIDKILSELTLEEKISLLTGAGSMATAEIGRLGLRAKSFADGPHGVRTGRGKNCTAFPNLCLVGSTWDIELVNKMGQALAKDCIVQGVDMLLGPGINIKRNILCGRNFEYIAEDPVLAGEIAYPFGHGLSYAKFEYSDIKVLRKDNNLEVSFNIKNMGDTDGAEVVQLYVGDPVSTVTRPIKELKAFEKMFVKSGETEHITLTVDIKDLGYYNVLLKAWVTEPGKYTIYIGASSQDIRLEKEIIIEDDIPYSIQVVGETMIG